MYKLYVTLKISDGFMFVSNAAVVIKQGTQVKYCNTDVYMYKAVAIRGERGASCPPQNILEQKFLFSEISDSRPEIC